VVVVVMVVVATNRLLLRPQAEHCEVEQKLEI